MFQIRVCLFLALGATSSPFVHPVVCNGIVSTIDIDDPRLKTDDLTLLLQNLGDELNSLSLSGICSGSGTLEKAMRTASCGSLWHHKRLRPPQQEGEPEIATKLDSKRGGL